MSLQLDYAIVLAAKAHLLQLDKAGQPYILHPLRVMLNSRLHPEDRVIAVLHDVVEDTELTPGWLGLVGLDQESLATLALLTRAPNRHYMDYVQAISENAQATRIKLADLEDNMDLTRLARKTAEDDLRQEKYIAAYELLTKALVKERK